MSETKQQRYARRVLAEMDADPFHVKHGTLSGRAVGCKCNRCVEVKRAYDRSPARLSTLRMQRATRKNPGTNQ